jgi:DNA modification methylase
MMVDAIVNIGSGARMAELPDASVSLVFTGPPYFQADLEPHFLSGIKPDADLTGITAQLILFAWSLRPVFAECMRVLEPGGRLVVQTRDVRLRHLLVPVESAHRQMAEAVGLLLFTRHLWRPKYVTLMRRRIGQSMRSEFGPAPFDPEVFLVFIKPGVSRPGEPTDDDLMLLESDICITATGHLPARHRFQTPIPMARALIRCHSRKGDRVVDPFMGGGTILRVARDLGRDALGWEIDQEAVQLARINLGLNPA